MMLETQKTTGPESTDATAMAEGKSKVADVLPLVQLDELADESLIGPVERTSIARHRPTDWQKPAGGKNLLRKFLVAVIGAGVLAAIGIYVYTNWSTPRVLPVGLIQANGRIEGDNVSVSSKFFGRVSELLVREGDEVTANQIVAQLESKQATSRVTQAQHAVAIAEASIKQAEAEAEATDADIKSARTSLELLRKQVPLKIATAKADLDHSNAIAASADSTLSQRTAEQKRKQELMDSRAVSQEEYEQARLAVVLAQNELTTTGTMVVKAERALAEAELGNDSIREREDQLYATEVRRKKVDAAIVEAKARRDQAVAMLAEAQSSLDDLTIHSPSAGTIVTRMTEQGETVAAGASLFTIIDLDRLYVQVYIPETEIGKLRLGSKAHVFTDAYPDRAFEATVRYIASQAEFTPKEVQTPDERVKLVYAVRVYFDENPDRVLSPGLPADAVIRWKDDVEWMKPIW